MTAVNSDDYGTALDSTVSILRDTLILSEAGGVDAVLGEGQRIGLSVADTGVGADSDGSVDTGATTPSSSDAGHFEESQILTLAVTADAGSAAETAMLSQLDADTGTGAEANSPVTITGTIFAADADTGTDAEAAAYAQNHPYGPDADAGAGADTSVSIGRPGSDTGTGTDPDGSVVKFTLISDGDLGSGADSNGSAAPGTRAFSTADTGAGADGGESVFVTGSVFKSSSDVFSSSEFGFNNATVLVSSADTGTGADAGGFSTAISGSDTGTGTDAIPGNKLEIWTFIPPGQLMRLNIRFGEQVTIVGEGPDAYVSAPVLDVHALRMVKVLREAPLGAAQLSDGDDSQVLEDWTPLSEVTATALPVPVQAELVPS